MSDLSKQIVPLYRRHAQAWDKARGNDLMEKAWLDRFLALMPPAPRVLDLGCGTGHPIADYLAGQGAQVTGVDAAPEMIEIARHHAPAGDWRVDDIRTLDLGTRFDGVLAWNSLFHLNGPDQVTLFDVIARHAADEAALMFTSGIGEGMTIGNFEGAPLYHASLAPETYRDLLRAHRFENVAHRVEDPDCGDHTIWLAQRH